RGSRRGRRYRKGKRLCCRFRQSSAQKAAVIFDLKIGPRRVRSGRMRQMMCAYMKKIDRQRHIAADLLFDAERCLERRCVLEILIDRKRERQHRSESGKCLVIEALAAELIVCRSRDARRKCSGRKRGTNRSERRTRNASRSLKHLSRVQQRRRRRASGRK